MLVPDQVQPAVYERDVAPNLEPGAAVLFAHGFNVHYGRIEPARGPRRDHGRAEGPGARVRRVFEEGWGTPALVAVARRERRALELALAYGRASAAHARRRARDHLRRGDRDRPLRRAGRPLRRRHGLIQAGFETLVEAGYQPEIAYYECINELKLIVDLIYEGGFSHMR